MHKNKITRNEKVAQTLLSGKPVTPDEIRSVFKGTDQEHVLYRLATNIWNIRKEGGIIKVKKRGRNIESYQLVNVDEFNSKGRYIGPGPKVIEVTPEGEIEVVAVQ